MVDDAKLAEIEARAKELVDNDIGWHGHGDTLREAGETILALLVRVRELEEACEKIEALPGRMHPVAGYMFDDDPRRIARTALGVSSAASGEERDG